MRPRRLNLAQSFNGLGAFIAAMFLSKLILSGNHYTRNTLPASFPGGWEGYIQTETDAMKLPYSAASYATHCYCHHLYLLQIT